MIREVEHLTKVSAVWYDTSNPFERRIMVRLDQGKLTIAQRDDPSDVWPPAKKLLMEGIAFRGETQ